MKKDNDPRHEIAMAIHHISKAIDLNLAMVKKRKKGTHIQLEAAKSWLTEAQEKVNK